MVDFSLDRTSETQSAPTFDSVWQQVARENSGFAKGVQAEASLIRGAVSNIVPGIKEAAQHAVENPLSTGAKLAGMVVLGYGLGMVSRASLLHTAVRGAFAYALLADGVRPMVRSTSFVWDNRNDMALQYQQKQLGRGLGHFAFDLGLTLPAIGLGVKLARTPKPGATPGDLAEVSRRPADGGSSGDGTGNRVDLATDTTSPVAETRTPATEIKVENPGQTPAVEVNRTAAGDGATGDASANGMSSPRPLHEMLAELAKLVKRPGAEPGGSAEVRAPEVVPPPEVRAPEVVRPAEGEVRTPEVSSPADTGMKRPTEVKGTDAEVPASPEVRKADGEVRPADVVEPVEAEVRTPDPVRTTESSGTSSLDPPVAQELDIVIRPPVEPVRPAETRVEVPAEPVAPVEARVEPPVEPVRPIETRVEPPVEPVRPVETRVESPVEPVRPVETRVEPPAEVVDQSGAGGTELKADTGRSAYEEVAPQVPRVTEQATGGGTGEPVKPGDAHKQTGGGKGHKKQRHTRPAQEPVQEEDPLDGIDARTRRAIEQDEADFLQNRGRKPRKDRGGGRHRGGKGSWENE